MTFNIRSLLMKTIDQSVETLGRECNLCVVVSFILQTTKVSSLYLCSFESYTSDKIQAATKKRVQKYEPVPPLYVISSVITTPTNRLFKFRAVRLFNIL